MRPVIGSIQIRNQSVAKTQEFFRNPAYSTTAFPGLFPHKFRIGRMQAVNWAEHPNLQPPQVKFIILVTKLMAADIVTPPTVAGIGGRSGKIWLKIQALPGCEGITGEAQRIPMTSQTGITGQNHGTFSIPAVIQRVVMVQRPERIQSGNSGVFPLLPIQPPEVHTCFFIRMVGFIQIGFQKPSIGNPERNPLLAVWIHTHAFAYRFVAVFIIADTLRGMDIQRNVEAILFQPSQ